GRHRPRRRRRPGRAATAVSLGCRSCHTFRSYPTCPTYPSYRTYQRRQICLSLAASEGCSELSSRAPGDWAARLVAEPDNAAAGRPMTSSTTCLEPDEPPAHTDGSSRQNLCPLGSERPHDVAGSGRVKGGRDP